VLFFADLEGELPAVFRTEDDPWGSTAEVAGYRFARWLGSRLVPPTVFRTLRRGVDAPAAGWEWKADTRRGAMQLFVKAVGLPDALSRMTPKERADVEVISFVIGRYDNHAGNLLLDAGGAPLLIDFEGALNPQQVRYGQAPFVHHGLRYAVPDGIPASRPFPFDAPRTLVNPTLEEVQRTFGPWWNQKWPSGMKTLHKMVPSIPDRTVRYAIWDDQLWVQMNVVARHPAHTSVYSRATLERLRALTAKDLTGRILTPEFGPEHVAGILERRDQLLAAARTGTLID
jgi:hypothetical protein